MKVVIKKPGENLKIIEVKDLREINKLTGNIDENGEGYDYTGSDLRKSVFDGIDMYVNENAPFAFELGQNFWDVSGFNVYYGNVIFAGFDRNSGGDYGVCSLSNEQIDYLNKNISSLFDIDDKMENEPGADPTTLDFDDLIMPGDPGYSEYIKKYITIHEKTDLSGVKHAAALPIEDLLSDLYPDEVDDEDENDEPSRPDWPNMSIKELKKQLEEWDDIFPDDDEK